MELYQVTIAYDGTEFKGFQRQKNARTVQNEIEQALRRLGWKQKSILAAGRTDTGVHAEGQVVAFQLDWQHTSGELQRALNDLLPADISTINVKIAGNEFHPRFDANQRKYRYQIYFSNIRNPILERYYWRVWPKPDFELLEQGSQMFLGRHDLRKYGRPPDEKTTSIRTIDLMDWEFLEDGSAFFHIGSKAFLYHMVRRIVFVLIRTAQKRIGMLELKKSIEEQIELPAGIAPAKGLILEQITY